MHQIEAWQSSDGLGTLHIAGTLEPAIKVMAAWGEAHSMLSNLDMTAA